MKKLMCLLAALMAVAFAVAALAYDVEKRPTGDGAPTVAMEKIFDNEKVIAPSEIALVPASDGGGYGLMVEHPLSNTVIACVATVEPVWEVRARLGCTSTGLTREPETFNTMK